jgi:hypothetical protein
VPEHSVKLANTKHKLVTEHEANFHKIMSQNYGIPFWQPSVSELSAYFSVIMQHVLVEILHSQGRALSIEATTFIIAQYGTLFKTNTNKICMKHPL